MTRRSHVVALAAVFALTSPSVMVAARYTAIERGPRVYQRLTGTYQLERSRGDDLGQAVEQATRALPANQRQGAYQRLMNRLNAPETIAIDRTGLSVTIASSRGQQVTFEADGQIRAEQGPAGQPVNTRATLYGDQLVVTTTGSGNGGDDFAVTFEPLDEGRSLRVTKRIYDDNLRQPMAVQSSYRKSSESRSVNARHERLSGPRLVPASPSVIGAITGGGHGAAIGAGGGAGTVIVQGRDQLDLPPGTELTITSGTF
jgi:hypothetical protein